MPYKLITGEFIIHYPESPASGPEPDGDTVRFRPHSKELLRELEQPGRFVDFNRQGMVSLRLEAIDALETHFNEMHQELDIALRARDRLLEALGFGEIEYYRERSRQFKVEKVERHPRPGYILARSLDTHGRVISFVFPGEAPEPDGSSIFVSETRVLESLNALLLKEGLVYPTFYDSLPAELRTPLARLSRMARLEGIGLWPEAQDLPDRGASAHSLAALERLVILPKLFRRLANYFASGERGLSNFDRWLRADPETRDDALLLPEQQTGHLHDIVRVEGNTLRLTVLPEDFVILDGSNPAPSPKLLNPSIRGGLRIIAALVSPKDRTDSESVTLINTLAEPIDLKGYSLRDRARKRFNLEGVIEPGETRRFRLDRALILNDQGDDILLYHNEAAVDVVSYGPSGGSKPGVTITF